MWICTLEYYVLSLGKPNIHFEIKFCKNETLNWVAMVRIFCVMNLWKHETKKQIKIILFSPFIAISKFKYKFLNENIPYCLCSSALLFLSLWKHLKSKVKTAQPLLFKDIDLERLELRVYMLGVVADPVALAKYRLWSIDRNDKSRC
jgi:hypothetical protein